MRQFRLPVARQALAAELRALGLGVLHARPLLAAWARDGLSSWFWLEKWARERPSQRALADDTTELTWLELKLRARTLGERLVDNGLAAGDTVVLLAENSTFFVVALLAIQWAGGCPLLVHPATDLPLLPHAIAQTSATFAVVERARDLELLATHDSLKRLSAETMASSDLPLPARTRKIPAGKDCFALLLSSGSTTLPKVVRVAQARAVLSGYGMGVMCLDHGASDTILCTLPLGHATALMTGLCPMLITGCCLVLRRHFSASSFWRDAAEQRVTSALYVGEIARRLFDAAPSEHDNTHHVRIFYGNGMPLDVWHRLQARCAIPQILEFYGATELPLAMVNLAGAPGYMGRIALRELSPWQIQRLEGATATSSGHQPGPIDPASDGVPGELMLTGRYRTGDIVVREASGYIRHIDRQPGMFRQNGYNVSCKATVTTLRATAGIAALGVTHVRLPRYDGQSGLLVIVPSPTFELRDLRLAYERLAPHQRPRFLRLTNSLHLNRGLKFDEVGYRAAGIDPERVQDPLYAYGPSGFVPIDSSVWRELQLGTFRF